jgi:hypothetical protein
MHPSGLHGGALARRLRLSLPRLRFGANGAVLGGPAPRALPQLEVTRAADGQLVVLADNEVPAGTRFRA